MLNAWVYLCGTTDQWSIDLTDSRNPYIPKQMSFSYLTNSYIITFDQSFTWTVDRFKLVWL